jgi:HEPN domain-containing protein
MNEESVKEWIRFADENCNAGITLFKNNSENFKNIVCYNMQQAVEKYLKAYLVANNIEIDDNHRKHHTHDIAKLIETCKKIDNDFSSLYKIEADRLTDYAVKSRYPASDNPSIEDERESISITEQVRQFIIKKINKISHIF